MFIYVIQTAVVVLRRLTWSSSRSDALTCVWRCGPPTDFTARCNLRHCISAPANCRVGSPGNRPLLHFVCQYVNIIMGIRNISTIMYITYIVLTEYRVVVGVPRPVRPRPVLTYVCFRNLFSNCR